MNNPEIRKQYHLLLMRIGELNKLWIQEGKSAKWRAEEADRLRKAARTSMQALMPDREEVKRLEQRNLEKYGSIFGPTFESLVERNLAKGLKEDAVYEEIIQMCQRTNYSIDVSFLEWSPARIDALEFTGDYTTDKNLYSQAAKAVDSQFYACPGIQDDVKRALERAHRRWRRAIDERNSFLEDERQQKERENPVCSCDSMWGMCDSGCHFYDASYNRQQMRDLR